MKAAFGIVVIVFLLLMALRASTDVVQHSPSGADTIAGEGDSRAPYNRWGLEDTAMQDNFCARTHTGSTAEIACGNPLSELIATEAFTITSIQAANGVTAWATDEQCDVDLRLNTTDIGSTFLFGAAGLRTLGEGSIQTGLSIAVVVGDILDVRHTPPDVATLCVDGAACVCAGVAASYVIQLMVD